MKPSVPFQLRQIPYYPLIIGAYAVFFLWLANYSQVRSFVVLGPLAFALSLTALVGLIAWFVARSLTKAAALAGLFLAIFFTFGHLNNLVQGWAALSGFANRGLLLLVVCALLWIGGSAWILRTRSDLRNLSVGLNLISTVLLVLTLGQIGYRLATSPHQDRSSQNVAHAAAAYEGDQASALPDVYYFLIDAYDREDFMRTDIPYDDQGFIASLERLGFVVPKCTQSNYNTTVTAMASTLNMNYLDRLGVSYQKIASLAKTPLTIEVQHLDMDNQVMANFQDLGYQIITLKEGWPFIDFPNSDIVYDYQADSGPLEKAEAHHFQYFFLQTTLLQPLLEATEKSPQSVESLPPVLAQMVNPIFDQDNSYNYQISQQNLYQLKKLESVAQVPGKKFVYAHLMTTHPPFTLTSKGTLRTSFDQTNQAYADAVAYADQRLLTIVQNILAQSKTPPVIILQGDHAYGWEGKGKDAFKILNAYYLPKDGAARLYPSITPVNTFRLIFSTYFGMNYPLISDRSILLDASSRTGYQVVPDTCEP